MDLDDKSQPPISSNAKSNRLVFYLLFAFFTPLTAMAHTESGTAGGFLSGFNHPLTGLDHIVAMVAVGLWGAFLGPPAMWILPVVFPVVMALGGALGILGVPIPKVEIGIALSGVILGLMVAFAARPSLRIAAVIVGFFAIFHGHAHGTELPESANALTFAIGFVVSTGLLHLSMLEYTSTQGVAMRLPFAATLAHVFNHGTHHRGQITAAITALGRASPELDLVWMLQAQSKP